MKFEYEWGEEIQRIKDNRMGIFLGYDKNKILVKVIWENTVSPTWVKHNEIELPPSQMSGWD